MVWFYMSSVGEMCFFPLLSFHALDQPQNVFRIQRESFSLEGLNTYFRD